MPTEVAQELICDLCGEVIRAERVEVIGQVFHATCFNCAHCQKQLTEESFRVRDGEFFCIPCFSEVFNKRCGECNQMITDDCYVEAMDQFFHRDHLVCFECKQPFEERKFIKNSIIFNGEQKFRGFCVECNKQVKEQMCHKCGKAMGKKKGFDGEHYYHDFCYLAEGYELKPAPTPVVHHKAEPKPKKAVQPVPQAPPAQPRPVEAPKPKPSPRAAPQPPRPMSFEEVTVPSDNEDDEFETYTYVDPYEVDLEWLAEQRRVKKLPDNELPIYSYKEVTAFPRPKDVDPLRRQYHLSDAEFMQLFKVSKADFAKLAKWRQKQKKKELNLF